MNFAHRLTAPTTLTVAEQEQLLRVTGESRSGFRDHVIYSLALGSGLREHEIAALDVGDVRGDDGHVPRRITLRTFKNRTRRRKNGRKPPPTQTVILSDSARLKVGRWLDILAREIYGVRELPADAPLFPSREQPRISLRSIRHAFREWQRRAGFERLFRFHDLRHTFVTNAYQESGHDIRTAQRLARHASLETTGRYTHPSDEKLERVARRLRS